MDTNARLMSAEVQKGTPSLKARATEDSIYDPMVEQVEKLQDGEFISVPNRGGQDPNQFQSTVASGLAVRLRRLQKPFRASVRQTTDGGLAIFRKPLRSAAAAPAAPAKEPKAKAKKASAKPAKKATKSRSKK